VLILGGVDSEPRDDAGRLAAAADEAEADRWKLDVRPRAQRQLTRLPEKIARLRQSSSPALCWTTRAVSVIRVVPHPN